MATLAPLIAASSGLAQVELVAPFVGDHSESFESEAPGNYAECLQAPILGGVGTICTPGTFGSSVNSSFTFGCTTTPRTGSLCYGTIDGAVEIRFSEPVSAFGAWFSVSSASGDATVTLYDWSDQVIGNSLQAIIQPDCTWAWNGWRVSNIAIARVTIRGNSFNGGAFFELDDLEVQLTNFVDTGCFGVGSQGTCPCGNSGAEGRGCANSAAGVGAQILANGSPSLTGVGLTFAVDGLPPAELVVLAEGSLSGSSLSALPIGDGLRCVRGELRRVNLGVSDGFGQFSSTGVLGSDRGYAPGDQTHYQLWYRDTGPSPCAAGTNMSNSISILWTP